MATGRRGVLHEFLPASEILRVAEAVLRVFQRFGDYQHKQRNRMKFMIRELGWTRWRAGVRTRAERLPSAGCSADARHRSTGDGTRDRPARWSRRRRSDDIASRVAAGRVSGPGIDAGVVLPVFQPAMTSTFAGEGRTSGRRSSPVM